MCSQPTPHSTITYSIKEGYRQVKVVAVVWGRYLNFSQYFGSGFFFKDPDPDLLIRIVFLSPDPDRPNIRIGQKSGSDPDKSGSGSVEKTS